MEALHDVVKAGKARYIGASSMYAWQFAKALAISERHGWSRFVSMQNYLNLLYREEEREMLPLCRDQGIGVIPWSPMARELTRQGFFSQQALDNAENDVRVAQAQIGELRSRALSMSWRSARCVTSTSKSASGTRPT